MIFFNPYRFASGGGSVFPETGMLAFYKGENDAQDSSGFSNHAAPGAGAAYTTGQVGQSFAFNGNQNSRILTPVLNVGSAYSVEFYAYVTTAVSGDMVLVVNDYAASGKFGGIYLDGTTKCLETWFESVSRSVGGRQIPLNVWFKVLFTYNGIKHRVYLNDLLEAEETGTHTTEVFNNSVGLGWIAVGSSGDPVLTGRMDEVKIYNYAKTPTYSGLIAQYDGENNLLDTANSIGWNGIGNGSPAYGAGRLSGSSFLFNGTLASSVRLPKLTPITGSYTIDAWVYPTTSATYQHIISGNWNGSANGALYCNGNKLDMSSDNYSLSNSEDKPSDSFSFSMMSESNDWLMKYPTTELTIYDPNQTEIDASDLQPKYDTAGRVFPHQTLSVPSFNLHKLFDLIYVQRCGFAAVRTNLPAYSLSRVDFDPAGTFHSSVNPFAGMFNPVNFVQGNEFWIVNVSNALPAGFPAPATLSASRIDGFSANREYNRLDGYTPQVSGSDLGNYYTTDLRQSVVPNGTLRTEINATYRQYHLRSQPGVIIGEVVKTQTVTEYDEAVSLSFITSRTREDFTYDRTGRLKSCVKFIEKLVPNLPGGVTEALRLVKTIESAAFYKTHPFEAGKQYMSNFTRSAFGLIAIDAETPFLGKPFPQDLTKSLEAGNLKDNSTFQEGQIEYSFTKYRPMRNGQVEITGATTDYVPAAVGRSPITKPHDPQQPSGDIALDAGGGNQSEIKVFPTDDYTPVGIGMEPFSVGPLPLEFAIPLARQNLFSVKQGRGQITANVIGLDMAIRRGSIRRIYDRDAEILATMVVEGIRKIFSAEKTAMILRGRQI